MITALKKANQYGGAGHGEKRSADGHFKTEDSFMAAFNARAKQLNDMPFGALPTTIGPDLAAALNFEGLELENGLDMALEIIKYLRGNASGLMPACTP